MVPSRLSMRNFLCYRENCPPLDFTNIALACLSGENGHGKSALLDAITEYNRRDRRFGGVG